MSSCSPSRDFLLETLQNVMKFSCFREGQRQTIESVLSGRDTLLVSPTGGGKSLTYQFPAIYSKKMSIVISPLLSLMADQMAHLTKKKIRSKALNSCLTAKEQGILLEELKSDDCNVQILYVTPERVVTQTFQILLKQLYTEGRISLLAVDEAHCISAWGHDFRSSYRKLSILKKLCPTIPLLACTATATPSVQLDIQNVLNMEKPACITLSFNRPNLIYRVKYPDLFYSSLIEDLVGELRTFDSKDCGIIYCFKKSTCEEVEIALRCRGMQAVCYHASLSDKKRELIHTKWISGTIQILVATIAFGLGIDKTDVRFVIHYSLPKSIEGYYQESGRAGRDGQTAVCLLYYTRQDYEEMAFILQRAEKTLSSFPQTSLPSGKNFSKIDPQRDALTALKRMKEYCEAPYCRRAKILNYFDESFVSSTTFSSSLLDLEKKTICCDFCTNPTAIKKCLEELNRTSNRRSMHSNGNYTAKRDLLPDIEVTPLEFEEREGEESMQASAKRRKWLQRQHQRNTSHLPQFSTAKQLLHETKSDRTIKLRKDVKSKGLRAVMEDLERQEAQSTTSPSFMKGKKQLPFHLPLPSKTNASTVSHSFMQQKWLRPPF